MASAYEHPELDMCDSGPQVWAAFRRAYGFSPELIGENDV